MQPAEDNTQTKILIEHFSASYGGDDVLRNVTLPVLKNEILAIFGPAGGGKTTLLRSINRLVDNTRGARHRGRILLDGKDVFAPDVDVVRLRRRVGMIFALPVPLPMSVYDNIAYGPRMSGIRDRKVLDEVVERSLRSAAMWDEVKDRLDESALHLSGGQQQRLSIARVLAMEPEVILLDEPTAALDPVSTLKIEQALTDLKRQCTVVIVPHSIQQAARLADHAAFILMGELVEYSAGNEMFTRPKDRRTEDYVTGRFG